MDGLLRGVVGILLGAWLYAEVYPFLQGGFLKLGAYGKLTVPTLLGVNPWVVVVPVVALGTALLVALDRRGL